MVVIFISIKYVLGGYEEIVIRKGDAIDFTIAGNYTRLSDSKRVAEIMQAVEDLVAKGKVTGEIAHVHLSSTENHDLFLGILFAINIISIPSGMEVAAFKFKAQLSLELTMHSLFRPKRSEVKQLFKNYADEKQLTLDGTLFEVKSKKGVIYIAPLMNEVRDSK